MAQAFGTGWLERIIRARFQVAGPQPFPLDLEPRAQVGFEARPSLPWEYGNARWFPVSCAQSQAAGGAGTFAVCDVSVVATAQRALVVDRLLVMTGASNSVGLYLNRTFVAPATGGALLDGRYLAAGSWFTPVADFGMSSSTPAALPAIGTRAWDSLTVTATAVDVVGANPKIVILPGQTISVFNETANVSLTAAMQGFLVPVEDLGS